MTTTSTTLTGITAAVAGGTSRGTRVRRIPGHTNLTGGTTQGPAARATSPTASRLRFREAMAATALRRACRLLPVYNLRHQGCWGNTVLWGPTVHTKVTAIRGGGKNGVTAAAMAALPATMTGPRTRHKSMPEAASPMIGHVVLIRADLCRHLVQERLRPATDLLRHVDCDRLPRGMHVCHHLS